MIGHDQVRRIRTLAYQDCTKQWGRAQIERCRALEFRDDVRIIPEHLPPWSCHGIENELCCNAVRVVHESSPKCGVALEQSRKRPL
ncbi:hypothetical protein rerp_32160 [Rhodococcus erythropolis]|nr:hypothetical protein rerp_32160 [Rhodococcus erythropolis]